MRYYIIGNKSATDNDYEYGELWLRLNGHTVINPRKIVIDGLNDIEHTSLNLWLIDRVDGVLCLDKTRNNFELEYAKQIGKKVKYLSKQWRLKQKPSGRAEIVFMDDIQAGEPIDYEKVCEIINDIPDSVRERFAKDTTIYSSGEIYNINEVKPNAE